ncbi:MAG: hypothetical protein FRX49_08292 [Trebouxia sp. A1-2]|nr:MAG: hypothetical protein FRX49_08292 [Trebouxia sp. A1-2]
MFWTLPALDTGQTILPMVSGSHQSSAHRSFGNNRSMTQPQIAPGTAGSLGVPEPPAVHARAPMQHYDFNINAIPFEPLSLKRGAAAPNAQQTFQHTSERGRRQRARQATRVHVPDAKPVRCLGPSFQDGERLLFLQEIYVSTCHWQRHEHEQYAEHTCSSCATASTSSSSSTSSSTRGNAGKFAHTGGNHFLNALALKLAQELVHPVGVGLD